MNIIGFYKHLNLVEKDGRWLVVNRTDKRILFTGNEDECGKMFVKEIIDFNMNKKESD